MTVRPSAVLNGSENCPVTLVSSGSQRRRRGWRPEPRAERQPECRNVGVCVERTEAKLCFERHHSARRRQRGFGGARSSREHLIADAQVILGDHHEPPEFRDHLDLRHGVPGKIENVVSVKLYPLGRRGCAPPAAPARSLRRRLRSTSAIATASFASGLRFLGGARAALTRNAGERCVRPRRALRVRPARAACRRTRAAIFCATYFSTSASTPSVRISPVLNAPYG